MLKMTKLGPSDKNRIVNNRNVHDGNVMWHLAGLRVESVGPAHCRAVRMFNGLLSTSASPANTFNQFAGPISASCFIPSSQLKMASIAACSTRVAAPRTVAVRKAAGEG